MNNIFFLGAGLCALVGVIAYVIVIRTNHQKHPKLSTISTIILAISSIACIICVIAASIATIKENHTKTTAAIEQLYSDETNSELYGIPENAAREALANYNPSDHEVLLIMQDHSKNYAIRHLYNAENDEILQAVKDGWILVTANNKEFII